MSGPAVEHVIRARRAVIDGVIHSAAIGLAEGVIRVIDTVDADLGCAAQTVLEPNVVLMPGLVDTHVHIDDPGTDWEGFATATVAALEVKRAAAAGACRVDTGFWGGIVPDNLESFGELATAGVLGFKCLLSESGNLNFPPLDVADFRAAMAVVAELGSVLLVHAESARVLAGCRPPGAEPTVTFCGRAPTPLSGTPCKSCSTPSPTAVRGPTSCMSPVPPCCRWSPRPNGPGCPSPLKPARTT